MITTQPQVEKPFELLLREAREDAARFNPLLRTHAGAAEALGVSDGNTVGKWERGECIPSSHNTKAMAEVYNAPHLRNLYCSRACPIGRERVADPRMGSLESHALHLFACSKDWRGTLETILDVSADGRITPDELPTMEAVSKDLAAIARAVESYRLGVERAIGSLGK